MSQGPVFRILNMCRVVDFLKRIIQMEGSVFPSAAAIALPCSIIALALNMHLIDSENSQRGWVEESIMTNTNSWSGFTFLVGFLIVFRTSHSYARFWEGTTAVYKMKGEYLDACASLMAFCRHSNAPEAQIKDFKQLMVRLFSMLFALALGELDTEHEPGKHTAFQHGLLDAEGIDEVSLSTLRDSDHQTCIVHQWIQQVVVDNISSGVLSIPPPILSRVFNELANGMCEFEQAMKISETTFPFPYTQVCDTMLFIHWVCIPWVVAGIAPGPAWAFVLSFVQVFVLWALNITAKELQQPYGQVATHGGKP